jgi:hypothetical protein
MPFNIWVHKSKNPVNLFISISEEKKKPTKKPKKAPKKRPKKATPKKKTEKPRSEWTEKEWEDWGERFGKRMEKWGEDFGKEMEDWGDEVGRRFKGWWFRSFGVIGPLFGTIFGIVCLLIGLWLLTIVNLPFGSTFLAGFIALIINNLQWFFVLFLFNGYTEYLEGRYPATYKPFAPLIKGVKTAIGFWILIWLISFANTYLHSILVTAFENFLRVIAPIVSVAVIVFGYTFGCKPRKHRRRMRRMKE